MSAFTLLVIVDFLLSMYYCFLYTYQYLSTSLQGDSPGSNVQIEFSAVTICAHKPVNEQLGGTDIVTLGGHLFAEMVDFLSRYNCHGSIHLRH